ncbi:hypothetical protein C8R45DRAFT_1113461 [Mycena sanguinolenta]|nr:hypothetical protein C8R45DRAFT_1113461 [Mycena sanguinolenta]
MSFDTTTGGTSGISATAQSDVFSVSFSVDLPGFGGTPRPLITTTQGQNVAREMKAAKYVEYSAKTRQGVQDVFDTVVLTQDQPIVVFSL